MTAQELQSATLTGELLPPIGDQPSDVVTHNDAIAQGLPEVALMVDVER